MSGVLGILWPALAAGLVVAATHVPLGMRVLERGIVFIDLAVAQFAALGVVAAGAAGFGGQPAAVHASALAAALTGALLLNWTERLWPEGAGGGDRRELHPRRRLPAAYALAALAYAAGLALSLATDLPAGPLVVCAIVGLGAAAMAFRARRPT